MRRKKFNYIYGPVYSWRLGRSLGIDPVSTKDKICNFDCIYCQLGRTRRLTNERKVFVETNDLIEEIKSLPELEIDYLTFSGRGEPTLAKNLGEMILALREIRDEKIAVITNSSLMYDDDVKKDLLLADLVIAKFDACSEETFQTIDKARKNIQWNRIVKGIREFKSQFGGKLALQIMFVNENKEFAGEIADIVRTIHPDEVELDTPLRPSAVKPLPKKELNQLKNYFKGMAVVSVYDKKKKEIEPFDVNETIKRHGNYRKLTF